MNENNLDTKIDGTNDFDCGEILNSSCNNKRIVTFVNPFSYYELIDSKVDIDLIDYIFIDGGFLKKVHSIFFSRKNRFSFDFSSIASEVFDYCQKEKLNVALIGGSKNDIQLCEMNIIEKFPELKVVLSRDGYFDSDHSRLQLYEQLKINKIDVVIVGMGTPRQEYFCLDYPYSNIVFFTCGGFITQTAINADYYFSVVKKLNLRWLQRAIMHSHVRRRLLVDYPKFIYRYIKEHL